jgi:hypothetical protein
MLLSGRAQAEPVTTLQSTGDPGNRIDIAVLGDGYRAQELAKYVRDAEHVVAGLFAQEPFRTYRRYFNVHRVDVVSNQSGATHPELGIVVDTALDASYDCKGVERLICVNSSKINTVLQNSLPPAMRDVVVVIVNDPVFGGSGGALAVVSTHDDAIEIFLHEMGHTLGLLTDEYGGPPPPECDDSMEPVEANATMVVSREAVKWSRWIDVGTPIPTAEPADDVAGLYEGARYCDVGVYRPTYDSKMRSLGRPFERVNAEQLVRRIYNFVSPIDGSSPGADPLTVPKGEGRTFTVTTPEPENHVLTVAWRVDGEAAGSTISFTLETATLTPGPHTVEVQVSDRTEMVRSDPGAVLTESASWRLAVVAGANLTIVKAGAGDGRVVSTPLGIDCGGTCTASFGRGVTVTLTPSATGSSIFVGWSGAGCGGLGPCVLSLTSDTVVTALFERPAAASSVLTVTRVGAGGGRVVSTPAGIDCGSTCSAGFVPGTPVTLQASPLAGSVFAGWSGGVCRGLDDCVLALTTDTTVIAAFEPQLPAPVVLTVTRVGTGAGTVVSTPDGIDCGSTCTASFGAGVTVTLRPSALGGSTFTGWSGGSCRGTGDCALGLTEDTVVTATFDLTPAPVTSTTIAAAVLPGGRSIQVGGVAAAFATILNTGPSAASGCEMTPAPGVPATFHYQTTEPVTNGTTGTIDTPVDIAPGDRQTFVFALTPTAAIPPTEVAIGFACRNARPAPVVVGVNTLLLSASTTPTADIVALTATVGNDGIVTVPSVPGIGGFAVATVNLGASEMITATADTGATALPVAISLCETNPASGECISALAPAVTAQIDTNATPSFGVFIVASASIPFDPAVNRIVVRFKDRGGVTRGLTSVAVRTE